MLKPLEDRVDMFPYPQPFHWLFQVFRRVRVWWLVETTVHELTRNRVREELQVAQAAAHLTPGPWALPLLFRRPSSAPPHGTARCVETPEREGGTI
jgi:hypothetical protein